MMKIPTKRDLQNREDVEFMVNTFYEKVNEDDVLSPIFNGFAEVDWPEHLPKMYQFWSFIILGLPGYKGQPFPPHRVLPISEEHFKRWLHLFKHNIDEHFYGPNAEVAKSKADHIAKVFQHKLGLTEFGT